MRRLTSLDNLGAVAIAEEIGSKYDTVKLVADNIEGVESLVAAINDGSFAKAVELGEMVVVTGVAGTEASWDGTTLTIPRGDKGDAGADLGVNSIEDGGEGTLVINFSDGTSYTTPDMRGIQGKTGNRGPIGWQGNDGATPVITMSYNEATGYLEYDVDYQVLIDYSTKEW